MGGSSNGDMDNHFGAMAGHWRKEAHKIMTAELKRRGIRPPSYDTPQYRFFILVVIALISLVLFWAVTNLI